MTFDLATALSATRIDWNVIVAHGHSIAAIRDEARAHGDTVLARRAAAALRRR